MDEGHPPDLCPECGAYWDCEHREFAREIAHEIAAPHLKDITMAAYAADWERLQQIADSMRESLYQRFPLDRAIKGIAEALEYIKEDFREEDNSSYSTEVVYPLNHTNAPLDVAVRCRDPPH